MTGGFQYTIDSVPSLPLVLPAANVSFPVGTAPVSPGILSYEWDSDNSNKVTARFNLVYSGGGIGITTLVIAKPADMPDPVSPNGFTAASVLLYMGSGYMATQLTSLTGNFRGGMRRDAANTGYEFYVDGGAGNYRAFWLTCIYYKG